MEMTSLGTTTSLNCLFLLDGSLEQKLCPVDLVFRSLQDDLLRFLGEVIRLVHLLQLVKLFGGVGQAVTVRLESVSKAAFFS